MAEGPGWENPQLEALRVTVQALIVAWSKGDIDPRGAVEQLYAAAAALVPPRWRDERRRIDQPVRKALTGVFPAAD